jgi:hypothetical protein
VTVRAYQVDPRDQIFGVDAPRYRVYYWTGSSSCSEWELTEADLDEVLAWVRQHADGRTHSLWVVLRRDAGVELVRLRGIDPPAPADTWPAWAVEVR